MKRQSRLKHFLLLGILMSLLVITVSSPGDSPVSVYASGDEITQFEDDIIEVLPKTPVDSEPEEEVIEHNDADIPEYVEYSEEEIALWLSEDTLDLDNLGDNEFYAENDGPPMAGKKDITMEDELEAIAGLPDDLRQSLEEEIRSRYQVPLFSFFRMAPQSRALMQTRSTAQTVSRDELTYDITESRFSGNTLIMKGYAFPVQAHNLYGSSTHTTTIILRNAKSGAELRYPTTLGSKDMSFLMSYNGFPNCDNNKFKADGCNYIFKGVDFTANINLAGLDPNVDYNMFLEVATKRPGTSTTGVNYRLPVYHQQKTPISTELSDKRKVTYSSDFKNTQMYTSSPYLLARKSPGKTAPIWDNSARSCGPNGKTLYFEQGKATGTFKTIHDIQTVDGVKWFKLGFNHGACKGGTGSSIEEVRRVRNRAVPETTRTGYLWGTSPFMNFSGTPLTIHTITPATSQEIHRGTDGKNLYTGPVQNRWYNEKWSFSQRSFADYVYQSTTGHARSGTFDNGSNKTVRTTFQYTPRRGDVKIVKHDENGKPVAGVVFEISYYRDFRSGQTWSYKTDAAGTILVPNWNPQTVYYREVSVPSPLIINTATKSMTVRSNATVSATVTNPIAKGRIEIIKTDENNKRLSGVRFRIRNAQGATVGDIVTNSNGVATTASNLPFGKYTAEELDVPNYYIKPANLNITLSYSNSTTAVVTSSHTVVNRYQPIGDAGVNRLRITTKPKDQGMTVEAWLDKEFFYDTSINNYASSIVDVRLEDYVTGDTLATNSYSLRDLPSYMTLNLSASQVSKGQVKALRVRIVPRDGSKVTTKNRPALTIDGYVSEERSYDLLAISGLTHTDKKVIRTERSYGQAIQYTYEHFTLKAPSITAMRSGSSFPYYVDVEYKNDLGSNSELRVDLRAENKILDATGSEYSWDGGLYAGKGGSRVSLIQNGNRFTPPQLYAKRDVESEIITVSTYNALSEANKKLYRKVEGDLVTTLWETDLGKYALDATTNAIGVHKLTFNVKNVIDTYAFMYGHFEGDEGSVSATISNDKIIVSPITDYDGNNDEIPDMWADKMPDNWGTTLANNNKALTPVEREFFGYDDIVYRFYAIFDLNGGTSAAIPTQTVQNRGVPTPPSNPTLTGYTFTGWSPSISDPVRDDTTYVAQWELNTYTVTFNSAGGSTVDPQSVKHGNTPTTPSDPTRTGYTFTGWSPAVNTVVTGNRTHTAQWKINTYTVSFDSVGGSTIASQAVNYGAVPTTPDNPTRTGYTFDGWSPAVNTVVTGNRTHTAQWKLNTYTVTFDSAGGSAIAPQTVNHGAAPTTPSNPTRTGYTFTGWSPDVATAVTGNRRHTAQWELNAYTVSFDSAGGSTVASQTVNHGDVPTTTSNPTRTGYTFTGWSPAVDTPVTGNRTHTAQWKINTYTVTFSSAGGSEVDPQTVNYGAVPTTPENPTRTGYTFTGWSPAIDTPVTDNRTHTAQWELNTYTVTFDSAGGSSVASQTVNHGNAPTTPSNPTRTGYIFEGWSPSVDTAVTGDRTHTAQWEIDTDNLEAVHLPTQSAPLNDGRTLYLYLTEYHLGSQKLHVVGELVIGDADTGPLRSGTAYVEVNENGKITNESVDYNIGSGSGSSSLFQLATLSVDINNSAYTASARITSSTDLGDGTPGLASALMAMGRRPFDPNTQDAMQAIEDLIPHGGLKWTEDSSPELIEDYLDWKSNR